MQIDKKFPIRRPLSQLSVTFVEFILLYELVKNEATGTHYWQVTATFTSTCILTKTLFVVGFPFCCPCRYVDLVLIHVPLQQEEKASLRCGLTAILQVMSNNACADGNSWKDPFRLSPICGHRYCNNTDTLRKGRSTTESLGSYSDLARTCKIHNKPLCRRLSINLFTNRRMK